MKLVALVLVSIVLCVGCAVTNPNGSASPAMSQQAQCERGGGVWRAAAAMCEQAGGGGGGY